MCIIRISAGKAPLAGKLLLQRLPDNAMFLAIRFYQVWFRSSCSRCMSLAPDPGVTTFGAGVSVTH